MAMYVLKQNKVGVVGEKSDVARSSMNVLSI